MQQYVVLEKRVGETPLSCMENWRAASSRTNLELATTPLTYAGRLDPMASGKLLVLIGDECKKKADYLDLDKQYDFSVLLGVRSDTADVLGVIDSSPSTSPSSRLDLELTPMELHNICSTFTGEITLPYPHYSSKTVQGKPLHTWAIEDRLDEIDIPTKTSTIYTLRHRHTDTLRTDELVTTALEKIDLLPPVTELRKAIGNDFRRVDVRASWEALHTSHPEHTWQVAHFSCIASSGTYMRTLAEEIAKAAGTTGLAFSIHRTHIGTYQPLIGQWGYWSRRFS